MTSQNPTLPQVVGQFTLPIEGGEAPEPQISQSIQLGLARLGALHPAEGQSRLALLERVRSLQLVEYALQNELPAPRRINMAFMKACMRGPDGWLVPQFALVDLMDWEGQCSLEIGHELDSYAGTELLYDVDRLSKDMNAVSRFLGNRRHIGYRWVGNMPAKLGGFASFARKLGDPRNGTGMKVSLVCDTQGQWVRMPVPADPIVVARVQHSTEYIMLGIFNPSPMEEWVAEQLTQPLF